MADREYLKLRDDPEDFFNSPGNKVLFFTREAAKKIFLEAAYRGWKINIYEGGIISENGFEARLDAIWHRNTRSNPSDPNESLHDGNLRAFADIIQEPEIHNAFVVTGRKIV